MHLVVGDGGNYEGPAIYEGHPSGWRQPQPEWSAFREASYGPGWGGWKQGGWFGKITICVYICKYIRCICIYKLYIYITYFYLIAFMFDWFPPLVDILSSK